MDQKIKDALEKLVLITLLSISIFGLTLQTFILKTGIPVYFIAMFLTSFVFAIALKSLKLGLLCVFAAMLVGVFLAWVALILPPLTLGESALVSFTTDIFSYYITRYILIGIPATLMGILIGSIVVDAL